MTFVQVPLGELVTFDTRQVQPEDIVDGTTYVGLESIGRAGSLNETVTVQAMELRSAKFAFDARHVLFGKLRPNLGKIARPSREGICSTDIYPVLPGPRLDRGYLAQFLLTPRSIGKAASQTSGANLPRISSGVLKRFEIPLPPLPEQRRIAAILDQTDELRTKRRRALELLDELADSLFIDMSLSSSNCAVMALGELASIASGITKGRKIPNAPLRPVPYLTVANVQDKRLNLAVVKTIEASASEIDRYSLKVDDLLLTEGGDPDKLGRGTLWAGELAECIHQNHVFRVRVTDDRIHPVYLNWDLSSARGKDYFLRSAKQTTGIASINSTQLKAFPVLVPSMDIQIAFAKRLVKLTEERRRCEEGVAAADELFMSLQSRAFRGEL